MPSHYGSAYGKKGMKGNTPMKRKDKMPNMIISAANERKLRAHAEHHSKKHMEMMRKLMREGKSFDEAHRAAQKTVGK